MPASTSLPETAEPDRHLVLHQVGWDQYRAISDALVERHNPRMIFLDGSLTFVVTSRHHDWCAERFAELVKAVADGFDVLWEDAAQATYRLEAGEAGVEGDKTFYFGAHAEQMLGSRNIDLSTQPPPDLAIEIEISDPATQAMATWGRLGVPEIRRYDAVKEAVSFWSRQPDGAYGPIDRSLSLPALAPADVLEQIRMADAIGGARWSRQLSRWVADVLIPRHDQGR